MYDSVILRTVARLMLPLLLLLSLFMLVRGHNLPGGGFIGGLLGASAIILQIVAFGPAKARAIIPIGYLGLAGVGLIVAAIPGIAGMAAGQSYMLPYWLAQPIPGIGKLGTPLVFDVGVYLTVIGVTAQLALVLAEEPSLYPVERGPDAEPVPGEA
ncbi:MAG TPA: MnhB domain-containing protein [Chloroflexaceae bacterium]|nr:MnhB domain-containing protein [Chloroflexaceae bacterium]